MKTISVDTIKVMFHVFMQDICFDEWEHHINKKKKEDVDYLITDFYVRKYKTSNGTVINLKFAPKDYYRRGENFLFVEFSLPKLLYGCNHRMLENWDAALDQANDELSKISGLPPLGDIREAILYRLDICVNFRLENDVLDYIQALLKGHYPHRTLKPYPKTGVIFGTNSGVSTSIYNKYEEKHCRHEEARGLLRLEISMRKKRQIDKRTGKKNTMVRDLTLEFVINILQKDLHILKLDRPIVCDRREIEQILSNVYTPRQVRSLLGYLLEKQTLTREEMLAKGTTRKTISYYERLLANAGVSSLSIDSKKTLPPLSITD